MNENEKSRSGLQTAVDFAHAARAAKRIMQAAAASGVHGAAAATAREAFPLLLKVLIAVLVVFIAVPMVIFTALPNIFFGYNSSGTDTVIQMTQQAMTLGGVYMTLGNFEGAQIDSVVTGIAAEYEKNGTTIDHIVVSSAMTDDDLLWVIAINSAAHQQDLNTMSADLIRDFCKSSLSNYARLHGGRLPVLTNFCLEEYLNIGYMEGISDVFNSIRGFNMSVQVAVQSLSQWKEKYPGMEWENQLGSFDMTLYMGCNDMTSAEYFAKKCGKVTISVTNNQFPLAPLFSPIYSTTRPYSQTRSNTQRDLLQPDEFLRLDKFKCIVMFNHYKPAELYKIMLGELPAYKELVKCSVFDYVPEWKRREDENKKRTPQKTASVPHETSEGHSPQAAAHFVQQENTSEKKQVPDREKACTRKPHAVAMPRQKSGEQCIYDFSDMKEGTSPEDIGLVEMTRSAVIGEDEPDLEELDDPSRIPPGCGI